MSSEPQIRDDLDSMVEETDPLAELGDPDELDGELEEPDEELDELALDDQPDEPDELADLALRDSDPVLLIWPREEYEQVEERWPEVLEPIGAYSWEDYRQYHQALITRWSRRGLPPLSLVTGTAEGFADYLADQGADPMTVDFVAMVDAYGHELADQFGVAELPPAAADPCWCGSKLSYRECCQPLSP